MLCVPRPIDPFITLADERRETKFESWIGTGGGGGIGRPSASVCDVLGGSEGVERALVGKELMNVWIVCTM
jgi:hypothetical protein